MAVEQEPATLDPRIGSDVAADRAYRLLYRGLFQVGDDFAPQPDLVETWEQPEPTRYSFTLKKGVRFSDGREVTAGDAAFTLRSIVAGEVASYLKGGLDRIEAVEARGRYTLEVRLREPYAPFLANLNFGILPAGTPASSGTPLGCGPYRLASWTPGQWLLFERNPYAEVPARSATVAFKVIPDPVVRSLEMRRGSVDLVVNDLPPDSLAYFQSEGFPFSRRPGANYVYLGLNCARPPLDRKEVRQAIASAVNRRAILDHILRGYGREATGILPPEHWSYDGQVRAFPWDPLKAAALLDAAGLAPGGGGVRCHLTYKTSNNKVSRQVATAIAQDLARVGIDVSIQWLEWGTFYGDVKKGDFDLFSLAWVGIADPDVCRLRFSSKAFPPEGYNRGRYANPEVDGLLEEGAREVDPERRGQIYQRVQEILAEEVPCVSLWYPDNVAVAQKGVEGIILPPDANFSFLMGVRKGD